MNVSRRRGLRSGNLIEMGNSSAPKELEQSVDIKDSEVEVHKEIYYKLFNVGDYKIRGFNASEADRDDQHLSNKPPTARKRSRSDLDHTPNNNSKRKAVRTPPSRKRQPKVDGNVQKLALAEKREKEAREKVRELEEKMSEMAERMNALITKEWMSNDELQGVRIELIAGLSEIHHGRNFNVEIGVKKIGELDPDAFIIALHDKKTPRGEIVMRGVELCTLWQEKIKDPHWYPFQIVEDDTGKAQRLLKEDDLTLQALKEEWGRWIYDAVVKALIEVQEHNPSGGYMVPELWNFKEQRKAMLVEVIRHVFKLAAVKDISKMGSTSDINNSRIKGNKERENLLKMGSASDINDSDKESDISDSEIYEHEERIYELLKSCTYNVRGKKGQFRCPFCSVEEEREYDYLLRHALTVAEGSSESALQRANHFALAKYLVTEFANIEDLQHRRCRLEDGKKEKALKTLRKENEELKRSNAGLLAKERRIHDELQRARKELAKGLNVWQSGKNVSFGIKKMGKIDVIPFKKACRKRFSKREADDIAADLCHMLQEQIKNCDWYPFRFVGDDKGKLEISVNDDDELLRALKQKWGDEVYNAVIIALKDLNEYSPRKRHAVPEIWNFNKNRKAKMEEVISFVFAELLAQKQLNKTGKTATQLLIKS
ncbi:hypothetical protein C2S51_003179 [Perilla frutescens var. frutescens]|nr:hypothetical protein C2S51_003179 [Perilla frutescens var. frutescens]